MTPCVQAGRIGGPAPGPPPRRAAASNATASPWIGPRPQFRQASTTAALPVKTSKGSPSPVLHRMWRSYPAPTEQQGQLAIRAYRMSESKKEGSG
jgi:hypothetical protein